MKNIDFFKIYKIATYLLIPFIWVYMAIRKQKGKEDLLRFKERAGVNRIKRPEGKLFWFHGASVGETLSMLPLIEKCLNEDEKLNIMVTSGTKTSAKVLAEKLPPRAFHQYVPIDYYPYVKRFVNHFKPDVAFWFESDFWPNILKEAHDKGVKLVLVNGRVSDKSFSRWRIFKSVIKQVLSIFDVLIAQSRESKERLEILSEKEVLNFGNLKFSALFNMKIDGVKLNDLISKTEGKKIFLAASTHKGEEEKIIKIHQKLKADFDNLITIIAPRHPNRGDEIEGLIKSSSLNMKRRSKGEEITKDTEVYLADTIGEMGVFYSLSKMVFVGGSLIKFGGQNMIEPMYLKDCVFIGPNAFNFREIVNEAKQDNALIEVCDENELYSKLKELFSDEEKALKLQKNASDYALKFKDVDERIYNKVKSSVFNENA